MTLRSRLRETRALPLSAGGWGGWMSDPAVIPPNSVYNVSAAGVIVNERSVMSLMVVASCIRIIGDTVSGLTPRVYKMEGSRRSRGDIEVDPPEVIVNPYADMDREEGDFKRIASLGLNGNFYMHIIDRNSRGLPTQVEILNPSAVHVDMRDGVKQYRVGQYYLNPDDVIHVPWISLAGGIVGVNPIEIGAIGFGLPIAALQWSRGLSAAETASSILPGQ
jgi:phage portal protein BeeE